MFSTAEEIIGGTFKKEGLPYLLCSRSCERISLTKDKAKIMVTKELFQCVILGASMLAIKFPY